MPKKDYSFISRTEWQLEFGGKIASSTPKETSFQKALFSHCALSMMPVRSAVCTPSGTVYELENILAWILKHSTDPQTGSPLKRADLVKLEFASNKSGRFHCPVTGKEFTEHSHIVTNTATGNVYSFDAHRAINCGEDDESWIDPVSEVPIRRKDLIVLQDPKAIQNIYRFHYVAQEKAASEGRVKRGLKKECAVSKESSVKKIVKSAGSQLPKAFDY